MNYTDEDIVELLSKMVEDAGSQKAVADSLGVSKTYLNDLLAGRKLPSKGLLKALRLKRIYTDGQES